MTNTGRLSRSARHTDRSPGPSRAGQRFSKLRSVCAPRDRSAKVSFLQSIRQGSKDGPVETPHNANGVAAARLKRGRRLQCELMLDASIVKENSLFDARGKVLANYRLAYDATNFYCEVIAQRAPLLAGSCASCWSGSHGPADAAERLRLYSGDNRRYQDEVFRQQALKML